MPAIDYHYLLDIFVIDNYIQRVTTGKGNNSIINSTVATFFLYLKLIKLKMYETTDSI